MLQGGYILHVRHAERQKRPAVIAFDVFETATGDYASRATYRDAVCLTPQGQEEATMLGAIFELAEVPVAEVIASPSCRALQTAELAFGAIDRVEVALMHTPAFNVANRPLFKSALHDLYLSVDVPRDGTVVVIAHGNTLENHPESSPRALNGSAHRFGGNGLLRHRAQRRRGALDRLPLQHPGRFAANTISLTH